MASLLKPFYVIRNHWKKSLFFSGVAVYGCKFLDTRFKINNIMAGYCAEAVKHGEEFLHPQQPLRHLTVILNPACNKRRAKKLYEQFIAPILHCAAIKISVIETENEGQARDYMEIMTDCDGVIVVGGDGTMNEAITGYLRRKDSTGLPIAFMPAGKKNYATLKLFNIKDDGYGEIDSKIHHVQVLGQIAMNIVKKVTRTVDVYKVEKEDDEKPLFMFYSLDLGILINACLKAEKYWIFGQVLRPYYPLMNRIFLKDPFSSELAENASLSYTKPCTGCSKCYERYKVPRPVEPTKKWWQLVLRPDSLRRKATASDISDLVKDKINLECDVWQSLDAEKFVNISIRNTFDKRGLMYYQTTSSSKKSDLIHDGIQIYRNREPDSESVQKLEFKDLKVKLFTPEKIQDSYDDRKLVVDRETISANSFSLTLLPNRLTVYSY